MIFLQLLAKNCPSNVVANQSLTILDCPDQFGCYNVSEPTTYFDCAMWHEQVACEAFCNISCVQANETYYVMYNTKTTAGEFNESGTFVQPWICQGAKGITPKSKQTVIGILVVVSGFLIFGIVMCFCRFYHKKNPYVQNETLAAVSKSV